MLELVLSLPMLLMVMGLMMLIGWAAAYKVRGQIHSREAAWRSIHRATLPGNGQGMPVQPGMPSPVQLSVDGQQPWTLNPPAELARYDSHPVVRGPVLLDPQTGHGLRVNRDLLDINQGMITGRALLERDFPVMGQIPPRGYRFDVEFAVLDNRWQFWQMGLASNRSRRSLGLYPDFLWQLRRITAIPAARFDQLAGALRSGLPIPQPPQEKQLTFQSRRQMDLFDRDPELGYRDYYHPYLSPPGNARTCDRGELAGFADQLIQRIQGSPRPRGNLGQAGIPGKLTQDFLNLYKNMRQQALDQNDMQSAGAYQSKIQQLETFAASLLQ